MRTAYESIPTWLMILVWFAFFAGVSALARLAIRRLASDDRRKELSDYSGKLLGALGGTFVFLIGFATTMAWSGMNAGQEAVDQVASSSQQLSWSSSTIQSKQGAEDIDKALINYLRVAATEDPSYLARGEVAALPSAKNFDILQDTVHRVSYANDSTVPEASAMVSAAATLTAAQAKVTAVAQRELPALLIVLLVVSGTLLAVGMGTTSLEVPRPYLMYAWAFVSAIAITVVLSMDAPFGGAIQVNLSPISNVVTLLSN